MVKCLNGCPLKQASSKVIRSNQLEQTGVNGDSEQQSVLKGHNGVTQIIGQQTLFIISTKCAHL